MILLEHNYGGGHPDITRQNVGTQVAEKAGLSPLQTGLVANFINLQQPFRQDQLNAFRVILISKAVKEFYFVQFVIDG